MKKAILISREGGETRACLLASGQLVNIDAEGTSGSSTIGNIYKGTVSDISRSLNAAFVDIGTGKEGFLSINDVHPAILDGFPKRPHMSEIFSRRQTVLVQVLRDPVGDKGAMLTTCISLPGRYVVLMPAVEKTGISKKLPEEERQRLREIIEEVEIPEGFGVIVRTAGADRKKAELLKDLTELVKVWNQIEAVYNESPSPSLVLQEQSLSIRFLREYLTTDVNEIVVDDEALKKEVDGFLTVVMPKYRKMLKHYTDRIPLFVRYNVEGQIEKMFLRDVPLPSGGRIVIDKTEALIAVDVNSGRHREKDIEETALRANMEAAQEIASQCQLRDLGGLVVIDFIDMYQQKNRNQVQQHLKECFKNDKAKVSFGRISQFGLLEMTRQKLRSGMVSRATESCSRCGGVGYVRTVPSMGLHVLRRIREVAVSGDADTITVTAPVEVANFMHNSLRGLLLDLERQHGIKVVILGRADIVQETIESSRQELPTKKPPAPVDVQAVEPVSVQPRVEAKAAERAQPDAQAAQAPPKGKAREKRGRDRGRKQGEPEKPQAEAGEVQAPPQPEATHAAGPQAPDDAPQPGTEPRGKRRRRRGRRSRNGDMEPIQAETVQDQAPADEPPPLPAPSGRPDPRPQDDIRKPAVEGPLSEEGQTRRDYTAPRPTEPLPAQPAAERLSWQTASPADEGERLGRDGLLDTILKRLLGLDR